MNLENEIFEECHSNQTKTGRGGARKNSGMKPTGIETVTVRIDKRLLNAVTEIKDKFKTTQSLDDIISKPTPKNDDAKLLKKIARLERDNGEIRDSFFKLLESERQDHKAEIEQLNEKMQRLESENRMSKGMIDGLRRSLEQGGNIGGLNDKLRKRLIQFCHPDKHADENRKKIAVELTQELNKL